MSNVMNPDGTHKLIAGYSNAAGLQERDQEIRELRAKVERLEAENIKMLEAMHEIYGRACLAMGEDDDLVLYGFAQEARDIALEAKAGLEDKT